MNKVTQTSSSITNSMRRVGTIQVGEIPVGFQESIRQFVTWYSTGLIGVADSLESENVDLIGSGTFIHFNNIFGILTAAHIIRKGLKEKSNNFVGLGLTVRDYAHRFVIPTNELKFVEFYHQGRNGPDIGVIIIPNYKVDTIRRGRNFWNLHKKRDLAMSNVIGTANYAAVLAGCPSEYAKEVAPESGFKRTISFGGISGATGIDRTWERGAYDYLEVGVSYNNAEENPLKFNGMSGAGLWKVIIEKLDDGMLCHRDPFLAGSVFWQEPTVQGQRSIYCHGTRSIYNVIFGELEKFEKTQT